MFFTLSKVLWVLAEPANALLLVLVLGTLLLWTRWRRLGRWLVSLAAVAGLFFAMVPVGSHAIQALEDRIPPPSSLPADVAGIVVLGGMIDQFVSRARGQVALNGAVERLTAFAELARRYPEARLIYSGGSGALGRQDVKEADEIPPVLRALGVDLARVDFENQSRNTYENAVNSKALAQPEPGETWIVITSAFHMPRTLGVFRQVGWDVTPYPVDYQTAGTSDGLSLAFNLTGGLGSVALALHEWLGLTFYWLTGRTNAPYPAANPDR